MEKVRSRSLDALIGAGAIVVLVLAFVLVPEEDGLHVPDGALLPSPCVFRAATDVDCPFCGLSRSVSLLAHGEIGASLAQHPGGWLLALAIVALLVALATQALRRAAPVTHQPGFVGIGIWVCALCGLAGLLR